MHDHQTQFYKAGRQYLLEYGHRLVGQPAPPFQVDARSVGTAILARLRFQSGDHDVVLKSAANNAGVGAHELKSIVVKLRAADDGRMRRHLPDVLAIDESAQIIAFSHVHGEGLGTYLGRWLSLFAHGDDHSTPWFTQAAEFLAWLHSLDAETYLPGRQSRSYGSFKNSFDGLTKDFSRVFRIHGFDTPASLFDRLEPGFFDRIGNQVALGDARPKNCIIRPDDTLCFIDLDWSVAPAPVGVGVFLVALDRKASTHPHDAARRRVAAWQRSFIEVYARHSDRPVGDELTFFYPWALLQMLKQHSATRPAFTPFLRWHYGRALDRFLRRLKLLSPEQVRQAPGELFGS